jgi:hypothetical protein
MGAYSWEDAGGRRVDRRLPLRDAAEVLGVSKDAVRQRVRRGTIEHEKGGTDGCTCTERIFR